MKKVIAATIAFAAIAISANAIGITIQNSNLYQVSQNGKKYVVFLGNPGAQVTINWLPGQTAQTPGSVLVNTKGRKSKTYTLNDCGFKNVAVSGTFPMIFLKSVGPIALQEDSEYELATEYLPEAPALPVCRAVSGEKVPYIIQGWQP